MTALLDYRLTDLLMFSPNIYYRMLERYNYDIWPLQILALGLGFLLLRLMLRKKGLNQRIAGAVLAIGWLWSGLVYNYLNFGPINWIAGYVAVAYVVEGLLLFAWGYRSAAPADPEDEMASETMARNRQAESGFAGSFRQLVGVVLVAAAVVGYPFLYLVTGEDWETAQIFLTSPGPTMVATLGLLLTLRHSLTTAFWLSVIPLLALLVDLLTFYALGSVEWVVLAVAGGCVIAAWLITAASGRRAAASA